MGRKELQNVWKRGNERRELRPNCSDVHKVNLLASSVDGEPSVCRQGYRIEKPISSLSPTRIEGLVDAFAWYSIRLSQFGNRQPIATESAIRVHLRTLGGLYKKYIRSHWGGRGR